ncbi:MAG: HesA/MoeB/ThiF family protein [Oscillospiraceae bacterium]|nr:HesA/MoeB/ThiF family protein [Oscillospiraceae bacterium]
MEARYIRNIPALTETECALLQTKKVAVIGCGGLGGYLIELLARIGIGAITVADGDVFEPSNLNRQLLSEVSLLGMPKAAVAAERIRRVNPDVKIRALEAFLDENNALELIAGCDAVLDALDSIEARRILAKACAASNIPLICGAIRSWVAQAAISMPGDGLMEMLYPEGTVLRDKSVLSFTPALCASMQAALCVRLLTGRPVPTGTLLYFDLLNQEFEEIPLV